MLVAIDPGTWESGVVKIRHDGRIESEVMENRDLLDMLKGCSHTWEIVIEMLHPQGRTNIGRETFETLVWVGRFMEGADRCRVIRVRRDDLRYHWCQDAGANDAAVRQAVLDHFGDKSVAIGTKASPGPLYGVKSHCWQALALGVAYQRGCRSKVDFENPRKVS